MESSETGAPLRIGLTGGIASGKSTVSDLLDDLGAQVIDTDVIAREIVEPGEPALGQIQARFGESVIDATGHLDRSAMRQLVFADHDTRIDLEAILHPRIGSEVRRQAERIEGPYQVIVVPLLVGSTLLEYVDRVLVVDCDESTQLERLLQRDAGTLDEAKRILAAQSSRSERLAIADDIVSNDNDRRQLQIQVTALHETYLALAMP